jgi:hypothetical protein
MEISAAIEINATPATVWRVLTDLARYEEWNPFMTQASGRIEEGAAIRVHMEPPGGRVMIFRPRILEVAPEERLRWLGSVLIAGLFDGEHTFEIEPLEGRRVRFSQSEAFSGLLLPLFARGLDQATLEGFEQMNEALKVRAEALESIE